MIERKLLLSSTLCIQWMQVSISSCGVNIWIFSLLCFISNTHDYDGLNVGLIILNDNRGRARNSLQQYLAIDRRVYSLLKNKYIYVSIQTLQDESPV